MKMFTRPVGIAFFIITQLFGNYTFADSGGPISPAQAAFEVKYYELNLAIHPATTSISGSVYCLVEVVNPIDTLVLDLDGVFTVDSVLYEEDGSSTSLNFDHTTEQLIIILSQTASIGEMVGFRVYYQGSPRISSNPPWDDGFVWETTSSGNDWLGVACETEGADIWWPCKDHPSDEPDSIRMSFTVPDPLVCVSNGVFLGSVSNGDGTTTYNWFTSTPVNNYNVTFYASNYVLIEDTCIGIKGDSIPFYFWVLPEDSLAAANHMDVFLNEFNFLESICGPFPFTSEKHGWAHAPYWGMEHQTIIAYGSGFVIDSWGMDYIHYHELAHEWWGNLITAKSWSDVWIHEGIATYTEALYVEHLLGMDAYHAFMGNPPNEFYHSYPLAPYEEFTATEAFNSLNPYSRGKWVMHTLRYHLGDSTFFNVLKRWAYTDSTDWDNTDGRLCRILTTDSLKNQTEEITGRDMDPFFDVFFRETDYPYLHVARETNEANFTWVTENNVPLDLNVPVVVNGTEETVEMVDGMGTITALSTDDLVIDPKKWIIMAPPTITTYSNEYFRNEFEVKVHPIPFTTSTSISYNLQQPSTVQINIYNQFGKRVEFIQQKQSQGKQQVNWDATGLPPGVYYFRMQAGGQLASGKMVLVR